MDILYRRKQATAAQVMESMPDPPGYSAVRTLLATLESKGYVKHGRDGAKYVYEPIVRHSKASRSAIAHLIQTFFEGSRGRAAAALLDVSPSQLSEEELDELDQLIKKARKGAEREPHKAKHYAEREAHKAKHYAEREPDRAKH